MKKDRKSKFHLPDDEFLQWFHQDYDSDSFEEVSDNKELNNDPSQTKQQSQRDELITLLLEHYVKNYGEKVSSHRSYKKTLFIFSLILISLLCISIFAVIFLSVIFGYESIALMISAFVSLVGLPIGILKIIAEYIFPKDEEAYITKIVESVQKTDLENKKTNIKAGILPAQKVQKKGSFFDDDDNDDDEDPWDDFLE